ncbi:hypothetical protein NDU88_001456 [Pleurodeles waltl]|uniref:Uncharacterized protein n=1 Tax=Pleurodeles waltl TaxID=8319 RepID=A0AAV7V7U9_PLEWA|nr:hypothetical protein NDU88_001456 [Pleurodeles waltl]
MAGQTHFQGPRPGALSSFTATGPTISAGLPRLRAASWPQDPHRRTFECASHSTTQPLELPLLRLTSRRAPIPHRRCRSVPGYLGDLTRLGTELCYMPAILALPRPA